MARQVQSQSLHYCEQATEKGPNKNIIYKLLDDLHCVIEKSVGENDVLNNNCDMLLAEGERLKGQLQCYETFKAELERKIQDLQHDNQQLQFCLEEQCQLREDLEHIVAQLKEQIDRQDNIISGLNGDKMELITISKRLEVDMGKYQHQCTEYQNEREGYTRGMRGFEVSKSKCGELQQALAECCERCDSLQKSNFELRKETRELEGNLDACCFEKNKILSDMECMKQTFQEEKDSMNAQLCRLLEEQATFNQTKSDLCRKLNEAIRAHHDELDRLKTEADMYRDQLEKERRDKEGLARTLREDGRRASASSLQRTGSCAEIRRQLSQANEQVQKYQSMYDNEVNERKLVQSQLRNSNGGNAGFQTKGTQARTSSDKEGARQHPYNNNHGSSNDANGLTNNNQRQRMNQESIDKEGNAQIIKVNSPDTGQNRDNLNYDPQARGTQVGWSSDMGGNAQSNVNYDKEARATKAGTSSGGNSQRNENYSRGTQVENDRKEGDDNFLRLPNTRSITQNPSESSNEGGTPIPRTRSVQSQTEPWNHPGYQDRGPGQTGRVMWDTSSSYDRSSMGTSRFSRNPSTSTSRTMSASNYSFNSQSRSPSNVYDDDQDRWAPALAGMRGRYKWIGRRLQDNSSRMSEFNRRINNLPKGGEFGHRHHHHYQQ